MQTDYQFHHILGQYVYKIYIPVFKLRISLGRHWIPFIYEEFIVFSTFHIIDFQCWQTLPGFCFSIPILQVALRMHKSMSASLKFFMFSCNSEHVH